MESRIPSTPIELLRQIHLVLTCPNMADATLEPKLRAPSRLASVDLLRGVVVILMALDHVRDFFGDQTEQPTNLAATTVPLFLSRWITHFCAPVFFLLVGMGAFLMVQRKSVEEVSGYLLLRGLWLIFIELVVVRLALQFNFDYHLTVITVLWALGWSMIALAVLIRLPTWSIACIAVLAIAGHNALDGVEASAWGRMAPLWTILHAPGFVLDRGGHAVFVAYVLIPWVAVTALGYVVGHALRLERVPRRRLLLGLGIGFCAGFVLLRLLNGYGDPSPWTAQPSLLWTAMSFVNTTKYPPSLLFLLMTLGPALLLLRTLGENVPVWLRPVLIIGRVPLFFYVTHFFVIHLLAVAASGLRYGTIRELFQSPDLQHFPFSQPPGWGARTDIVVLLWVLVVVIMFPLCRWYADLKRRRTDWWLAYI
jgi:uncharacterized membrane protein